MSKPTAQDILTKLENVEQKSISHQEKYALVHQIVYASQDGSEDIALFLKSIDGINNENLYKILVYLEKYDELSVSLGTSTSLADVIRLIQPHPAPNDKVKSVLLEMLLKAAEPNTSSLISQENAKNIVRLANGCILQNELDVANVASKLVERLIAVYPQELIASVHSYSELSPNSTIQLRFVTLLCNQASKSNELFLFCLQAGAVDTVINLCKEPDILMQINALDFLPILASNTAGLDFLCENTLTWLINIACEQPVDVSRNRTAPDPVLCTEALRVLGTIFHKAAAQSFDLTLKINASVFKLFLTTILNYFEERDESHKIAGIGILHEFVTVSLNTFTMVLKDERLLREWIGLLKSSKPELGAAVLHSIAKILYQDDEVYVGSGSVPVTLMSSSAVVEGTRLSVENGKQAVKDAKKRLLTAIDSTKGVHHTDYLLKTATSPVTSIRFAAVDLMTAIVAQPSGWGLLSFVQSGAGFSIYVANRETEFNKEGKDWKFSLIKAISLNPSRQMLSEAFNKTIDLLVSQGPYFMPSRVDLMTA